MVGTQRASALPFGTERAQALLAALLVFRLLPQGFRNRDLRAHLAPLLGIDLALITPGRMTYELRRLRLHGLIERIPDTHRYRVTDHGLAVAIFLTRVHNRLIRTGLADLQDRPDHGDPAATIPGQAARRDRPRRGPHTPGGVIARELEPPPARPERT